MGAEGAVGPGRHLKPIKRPERKDDPRPAPPTLSVQANKYPAASRRRHGLVGRRYATNTKKSPSPATSRTNFKTRAPGASEGTDGRRALPGAAPPRTQTR